MQGSMQEWGPGKWRMRVYVGRDQNNRTIHTSRNFTGTKSAAQRALRAFVTDVESSRKPQRDTTMGDLFARWLEHIAADRTPSTLHSYRLKIDGRILPMFGHVKISRIDAEMLDRQYRRWVTAGLSPTTVRQYHAIISAALQQAYRWGWLAENPAKRAQAPRVERRPVTAMTIEALRELVSAAEVDNPVLGTAVALAALTGARRGELCGLRWTDVDLRAGMLRIERSVTDVASGVHVGDTKTHQGRTLALDPVAVAVLRRRRAFQEELAAHDMVRLSAHAYVLSRRSDGTDPCLPGGLSHGFIRVRDRLGLPWHFHDLRHFAATAMITGGTDVRTTAARLGHADASTTLRVYAHAVAASDQAAAALLGLALGTGSDHPPKVRLRSPRKARGEGDGI